MPSTPVHLAVLAQLQLPLLGLAMFMAPTGLARASEGAPCTGTALELVGRAELRRSLDTLGFSLQLLAEESSAPAALAELQRRLARVRDVLQSLGVKDLRVTSPSTWERPAQRGKPVTTQAQLRVSGTLVPDRLQPLVREVGSLPGVRLAPVESRSDERENVKIRRRLLELAYEDALVQARDMGAVLGRTRIDPVQIAVQGEGFRPLPGRAMAADAGVPPFDPDELPAPLDRLTLQVRFCLR
jgi:uncharacterized protein YggE